jgi:hypothetical protein
MAERAQAGSNSIIYADAEQPTKVTLHVKNGLLKDVLADLSRQAGVEVTTTPESLASEVKNPLNIDAEGEPFWKVTLDICRQAQLTPAEMGGIGMRNIVLKRGQEPSPRAEPSMRGCFHITPVFAISGGAVSNRTILSFRMLVDPRLSVLRSTTFIATTQVSDSAGHSLLYKAPFSSDDLSAYYNWNWSVTSHILTPGDDNVADFKGTVRTQVQGQITTWEVTNALAIVNQSRDMPFGKATVAGISKVDTSRSRILVLNDVYSVSASFDIAAGKESEVGGHTAFGGMVRLYDEAGNASEGAYFGSGAIRDGHVGFSTTVNALTAARKRLGPISRLQWDIPGAVREITVPIEFKNINAHSQTTR